MKKDDRVYLEHIISAAARIRRYTGDKRETFMGSDMVQDAVIKNLSNLAESASKLSEELKTSRPEVEWKKIVGFRNILVHNYLGDLELEKVWQTLQGDLSRFVELMQSILKENYDRN